VQIQCEHCGAGYDLQLPPTARAGGRNLKFRCASCGQSFVVVRADGSRPEPTSTVVERGYRVEDGAATRQVPDLATLQRLVASRELGPAARVTGPDGVTRPAQGIPELAVFFDLVHRAERGSAAPSPLASGGALADSGGAALRPEAVVPSPAARGLDAPAAAPDDLSWLDASMPSAADAESEGLGQPDGVLAALESGSPSQASGRGPDSGASPARAATSDEPVRPQDEPAPELDWMRGTEAVDDLQALEDLSWLDAPEPDLPGPGSAEEPTPALPSVPPGAAADDVAWLEAANDAVDGAARGGGGTQGDTGLGRRPAAPSDAPEPPAKVAVKPAFDEDLAWLMDPALDASGADGSGDPTGVSWDEGGDSLGGGDELPEEIRALAAGLAVPAMPGPTDGGKGVFARSPVKEAGADDEFWDDAVSLGHEDPATEEAPRPGVRLGDESNTMDIAGGSFAAGSDDGFDDLDGAAAGGNTGRWLAVAAVALLVAGGGWWWTTQTVVEIPSGDGSERPVDAGGEPATLAPPPPSGSVEPAPSVAVSAEPVSAASASALPVDRPVASPPEKPEPAPPATARSAPSAVSEARKPDPAPEAAPRAASAAPVGVKALVDRGWSEVDATRLDEAGRLFARAIQMNPTSGDAHFGAGYVAELSGSGSDAYREYCLAQFHGKGNVTLEREVAGRLRAIGRSCD